MLLCRILCLLAAGIWAAIAAWRVCKTGFLDIGLAVWSAIVNLGYCTREEGRVLAHG